MESDQMLWDMLKSHIDEFLSLERDYDNGDFRMNEKGCRIWFDNYTCYCESDSHTEEWLILPV